MNSKKFHLPTCPNLPAEKNQILFSSYDEAVAADEPGVRSLCLKKSVSESLISLVFACIMTYLSSVMPLRASDIYMHGHAGVYQEDGLPTVRGSKVDVVL